MKYYMKVNRETKKIMEFGDFTNGDYPNSDIEKLVIPIVQSEYNILSACNGDIE